MARVKMTEKEKQLGQLYKRLKIVLKAYNEGKTYKDYESIIYDLKKVKGDSYDYWKQFT